MTTQEIIESLQEAIDCKDIDRHKIKLYALLCQLKESVCTHEWEYVVTRIINNASFGNKTCTKCGITYLCGDEIVDGVEIKRERMMGTVKTVYAYPTCCGGCESMDAEVKYKYYQYGKKTCSEFKRFK